MSAFSSSDALLKKETGTPGVFANVAQVAKITPPAIEPQSSEKYVFGQAAPFVLSGRAAAQEVSLELVLDRSDADHLAFETDAGNGTVSTWQIEFPDNRVWEFDAKVTSYQPGEMDAESTDAFTASVTLKLTSAVTATGPA